MGPVPCIAVTCSGSLKAEGWTAFSVRSWVIVFARPPVLQQSSGRAQRIYICVAGSPDCNAVTGLVCWGACAPMEPRDTRLSSQLRVPHMRIITDALDSIWALSVMRYGPIAALVQRDAFMERYKLTVVSMRTETGCLRLQ